MFWPHCCPEFIEESSPVVSIFPVKELLPCTFGNAVGNI
jgi:hypothetical protein